MKARGQSNPLILFIEAPPGAQSREERGNKRIRRGQQTITSMAFRKKFGEEIVLLLLNSKSIDRKI